MDKSSTAELVADCAPARALFDAQDDPDVMWTFNVANQLHMYGRFAAASSFYKWAYDLHSKRPDHFPVAHGLLQVRLLCLLKAGLPLPGDELEALRDLSTPFHAYILGARELLKVTPDLRLSLSLMGNSFEEFHTGEEADRIYLRAASSYFGSLKSETLAPHGDIRMPKAQAIPRRLFLFWDKNPPEEIKRNFAYHEALNSFDVEIFDNERASKWLYNVYGVPARQMFLNARHPAEAADILRLHVINAYGGYWLDADMKIRSVELFNQIVPTSAEAVFPITHDFVVHNDFFGARANDPILNDSLLSLYHNWHVNSGLYIAYKTGPGIYGRALNRLFYRALLGIVDAPKVTILSQEAFDQALHSYPVTYKQGSGSWHNAA